MGGAEGRDGLNAVDSHGGNCALLSAEIMETLAPVRVLKTELAAGSGGKGAFRGGLGIVRDYEMLADNGILTGYCQQTRHDTAPWGFCGGNDGALAALVLNPGAGREESLKSKVVGSVVEKGDVLRLVGAGGGGWGNPAERNQVAVVRDQAEGYI